MLWKHLYYIFSKIHLKILQKILMIENYTKYKECSMNNFIVLLIWFSSKKFRPAPFSHLFVLGDQ